MLLPFASNPFCIHQIFEAIFLDSLIFKPKQPFFTQDPTPIIQEDRPMIRSHSNQRFNRAQREVLLPVSGTQTLSMLLMIGDVCLLVQVNLAPHLLNFPKAIVLNERVKHPRQPLIPLLGALILPVSSEVKISLHNYRKNRLFTASI